MWCNLAIEQSFLNNYEGLRYFKTSVTWIRKGQSKIMSQVLIHVFTKSFLMEMSESQFMLLGISKWVYRKASVTWRKGKDAAGLQEHSSKDWKELGSPSLCLLFLSICVILSMSIRHFHAWMSVHTAGSMATDNSCLTLIALELKRDSCPHSLLPNIKTKSWRQALVGPAWMRCPSHSEQGSESCKIQTRWNNVTEIRGSSIF